MKKLTFLGLVALMVFVSSPIAMAIEQGGVGGRPANPRADNPRSQSIFVHNVEPGQTVKDAVEVINNTDEQKTVLVYGVDSQVASGGSFACAQMVDDKDSVGAWIELAKNQVTLAPKQKEEVAFTISVPSDAGPGEYNGCIALQDATQKPIEGQNGVVISLRSAIRVALTVPGDTRKEISIAKLGVDDKGNDKLLLYASLRNTGNVSIDTKLNLRLKNIFGVNLKEESGSFPVLSGTQGDFNFGVDKPFWGGIYVVEAVAAYNPDLEDSLGEGSQTKQIQASKVVFLSPQPLALLLLALLLLAILVGIGYWLRSLRTKRHWETYGRTYVVKEGDDLELIAEHFGLSWRQLAKANQLKAPYKVRPGQRLTVIHKPQRAGK